MTDDVDIERYLTKKDPDLGCAIKLVRAARGERLRPPLSTKTPFEALVRAVIYQRVSENSGATVYSRLKDITGGKLTPTRVAALSPAKIVKAGMNSSKAKYICNVAAWFEANPKVARKLPSMSNEEIVEALSSIAGIGPWTINVLLVFNLGRLDVIPNVDTVIRSIAKTVYGLNAPPSAEFVRQRIEKWKPYRSIATMYLYQFGKLKLTSAEIRAGRAKIDQAATRSGT